MLLYCDGTGGLKNRNYNLLFKIFFLCKTNKRIDALKDALKKFPGHIHASPSAVLLRNVFPSSSLSSAYTKLLIGYVLGALGLVIALLCHLAALVRNAWITYYTWAGEDVPDFLLQL